MLKLKCCNWVRCLYIINVALQNKREMLTLLHGKYNPFQVVSFNWKTVGKWEVFYDVNRRKLQVVAYMQDPECSRFTVSMQATRMLPILLSFLPESNSLGFMQQQRNLHVLSSLQYLSSSRYQATEASSSSLKIIVKIK